jgi:hypothetical protein
MWRLRILIAVLFLQIVGIAATVTWELAPDPLGPLLWATSFIGLMPGDVVAPPIVEHFLWQKGPSLRAIAVVDLIASVSVNVAIAGVLLAGWRVRGRVA